VQQRKHLRHSIGRLFRMWDTFYAREWDRSQMQSADAACRSLRFENPSKTFLSLPVLETEERVRRRGTVRGTEGFSPFCLTWMAGAEFSVATQRCAPQGSLDFGYPDELTAASVDDEISPRNRAQLLRNLAERSRHIRVRGTISCLTVNKNVIKSSSFQKHLLID